MGLPWFKLSTDLPTHPKAIRLGAILKDRHAYRIVCDLLLSCARSFVDGRFPGPDAGAVVEGSVGWDGKAGMLADALIASGFLDRDGDDLIMHGWKERNGAHAEKIARDRAKPRADTSREVGGKLAGKRGLDSRSKSKEGRRETTEEDQLPSGADAPEPGGQVVQVPLLRLEPPPPASKAPDLDALVYDHWRHLHHPKANPVLDPERRRIIAKRRAERSLEPGGGSRAAEVVQRELLDSLSGWKNDPWTERKHNTRLDQVLGNAGDVDRGLEFFAKGPPPKAGMPADVTRGYVPAESQVYDPTKLVTAGDSGPVPRAWETPVLPVKAGTK